MELLIGEQRLVATPGEPLVVGRARPDGPAISDSLVSHRHLVLSFTGGAWTVRDESRNGTFLNGARIGELRIAGPTTLHLGGPQGVELHLRPAARDGAPAPPARREMPDSPGATAQPFPHLPDPGGPRQGLSMIHPVARDVVRVGRAPDNDIVLSDLLVSRYHARLVRRGPGFVVEDLGSHNGTFVDGARVRVAPVGPSSIVGIGHQTFRLTDGLLEEYADTGRVTFEARQVSFSVGGKRLLDNVSFFLEPDSLLAIVGPSGSGKSTLLKALTGSQPATSGQVGYGGRDLYSNFDEIRNRIGFVPQDDILHPQLRVRQALEYAGRLRFPQDVTPVQRAERVREVIADLGLHNQAGQRIDTLSGGQRKRTSTALELLTRPSLLFLDEPTSGLDVNRDREVMLTLRRLADGGRTVIVVSHNVAHLNICDRLLVLAPGGRVAYYGPPQEALAYFGETDYADMYAALEEQPLDWRGRFEASPQFRRHVLGPSQQPIVGAAPAPRVATRQQTAASQFVTLARRNASVIVADKPFVTLTVVMPLVLALFAHAVPGSSGLSVQRVLSSAQGAPRTPIQLLLVLILGGCLTGSAASVREIVKERSIFARERAIGLSWPAYLAAKTAVLALITGVQAVLLTVLGTAGRPGPDSGVLFGGSFEIVLAIATVTLASMTLGLVISAVVSNADRTMPLLVLVIMAQLLASGGLFPVRGRAVLEQLSWLAPARWGYGAGAATVDVPRIAPQARDPLWTHSSGTWVGDLLVLGLLAVLFLIVTGALLSRVGRVPRA